MREAWKAWEGRVVGKEFRLGDYLGGSERAAVFTTQYGPESRKAAVKLIPTGNGDQSAAEAELARLESTRALSHPNLLQILKTGRATVDDTELIYVVMERADEDLSQILPNRPLSEGEVREMLPSIMAALAYLHGKGFVHGRLKPANVLAIGDQLKLSSDAISPIGGGAPAERGEYDAPEIARGEISAASDIWSLGMVLVTSLTQRLPGRDASGEAVLPENLAEPFDEIVRNCLRPDASARWGLAEIAARAGVRIPASEIKAEARAQSVAALGSAAPGKTAMADEAEVPAPRKIMYKRGSNKGAYIAVAAVLVLVGILVGPRLFRSGTIPVETAQAENREGARPQANALKAQGQASPESAEASAGAAQVQDGGANSAAPTEANSPSTAQNAGRLTTARDKTSRRGMTAGQVADQVIPEVPESARNTIHGTVRVGVRVSVDSSGNVTEAELDSPGPSKYFARLALEAAQQWKFEPPKMEGREVLSDWLLRFQFTGQGTKVIPVQSDP